MATKPKEDGELTGGGGEVVSREERERVHTFHDVLWKGFAATISDHKAEQRHEAGGDQQEYPSRPNVMSFPAVRFVTDFADQAMILPLIACVAVLLWVVGWRRGALVWCLGTGATLGLMLLLKMGFRACGPTLFGDDAMLSPSGHTAAAGAVYGSILAFINGRLGGREASRWLVVLSVVVLVGGSRVLLGAHTPAEAVFGGLIGFAAAQAMIRFAGVPVMKRSITFSLLPLLLLPLLFHGIHLKAEEVIQATATNIWPFTMCRQNEAATNAMTLRQTFSALDQ